MGVLPFLYWKIIRMLHLKQGSRNVNYLQNAIFKTVLCSHVKFLILTMATPATAKGQAFPIPPSSQCVTRWIFIFQFMRKYTHLSKLTKSKILLLSR